MSWQRASSHWNREDNAQNTALRYDASIGSHCAIEDIGHEEHGTSAHIERGHVPRTVDAIACERGDRLSTAVQNNQTARPGGCGSAICSRQTTDNNKARAQSNQCGGQSYTTRTSAGQGCGIDSSKETHTATGGDLNNRSTSTLKVGGVIEVANQYIVR